MNATDNLIETLKERVHLNPKSPLFLSLAEELKKQGRMDDAVDALLEGLRINPGFVPARLRLAKWYLEAQMYAEAMREVERVLAKRPDDLNALRLAFQITKELGELENALQYARAILRLRPDDSTVSDYINEQVSKQQSVPCDTSVDKQRSQITEPLTTAQSLDKLHRDLRQIELLLRQSRYREASKLCDLMLSEHPTDRRLLQTKEEIHSLIGLLKKGRERVIDRLHRLKGRLMTLSFKVN